MSLISRMRRQKAVYWAPVDADGRGQTTFADPVEINCRWEETAVEFVNAQGATDTSQVVAYVDRDVEVGGRLKSGTVADLASDVDPTVDGYEIKQFSKNPNFKASEFLRTAYC